MHTKLCKKKKKKVSTWQTPSDPKENYCSLDRMELKQGLSFITGGVGGFPTRKFSNARTEMVASGAHFIVATNYSDHKLRHKFLGNVLELLYLYTIEIKSRKS